MENLHLLKQQLLKLLKQQQNRIRERIKGAIYDLIYLLLFLVYGMNAFTVDIAPHLEDAPKFIKLGSGDENVYKVNDSKNTVLLIQETLNKDSSHVGMAKALELGLGKEAAEKIEAMDISFTAYQNIFIGMMAAISTKSYEEMDKTFRKSQE